MRLARLVGIAALLGGAFTWGFLARHHRTFPHDQVFGLHRLLGGGNPRARHAFSARVETKSPAFSAIRALPYVDATFDPEHDRTGVIDADGELSQPGLNLFTSHRDGRALLLDERGEIMHEWGRPRGETWSYSSLRPNGDLLVIIADERLLRLDRDSKVLWDLPLRAHHGLDVHDGRVYLLTRQPVIVPDVHPRWRTLVDFVTILGADGAVQEKISILHLLKASPHAYLIPSISHVPIDERLPTEPAPLDVLHTNHVEVFDGRLADRSPLFAAGNLLLSCRNISTILIVDGVTHEILWLWGPTNLALQHHPQLLDSGNILVFDNGRSRSRIVELDPDGGTIVWTYQSDDFFTPSRGSVQRLTAGNTLITESNAGYVFEVTPDHQVVWTFANPDVDDAGMRGTIYRMTRFDRSALPFLDGSH